MSEDNLARSTANIISIPFSDGIVLPFDVFHGLKSHLDTENSHPERGVHTPERFGEKKWPDPMRMGNTQKTGPVSEN